MKNIQHYYDTLDLTQLDNDWNEAHIEDVASSLGLYGAYGLCNKRLKEIAHKDLMWVCTDTHVGISFLFLDKVFVGISMQTARKSDKHYYWKDVDGAKSVRDFIVELMLENNDKEIEYIDFEQDISEWEEHKIRQDELNRQHYEKYIKPNLTNRRI